MYPWKNGTLNVHDYKSIQEVLGDLQTIWTETIRNELEIDEITFEVVYLVQRACARARLDNLPPDYCLFG